MRSLIDNLVAIAVIAGIVFVTIGTIRVLFFGYMSNPVP